MTSQREWQIFSQKDMRQYGEMSDAFLTPDATKIGSTN